MSRRRGGVRVDGFDRLRGKLARLSPATAEGLSQAIQRTIPRIARGAAQNAPRDEGDLAASYRHEMSANGLRGRAGSNDPKAPWVELGHFVVGGEPDRVVGKAAPHPHLHPAAEAERGPFRAETQALARKAVREVARGAGGKERLRTLRRGALFE